MLQKWLVAVFILLILKSHGRVKGFSLSFFLINKFTKDGQLPLGHLEYNIICEQNMHTQLGGKPI